MLSKEEQEHVAILLALQKEYESLSTEKQRLELRLDAQTDVKFWMRQTWVRFGYVYANNELNEALGRAGQTTMPRYGTRKLDLIPTNKHPKSRRIISGVTFYFDTGKFGNVLRDAAGKYKRADGGIVNGLWRGFRDSNLIALTGVWSKDAGKFVSIY